MQGARSRELILLSTCVAILAGCASGTDGISSGNTEINLDIVNPGGTSGELGFSVDRVDYRITCASASYFLPPHNSYASDGAACSTADSNNDGIPDVCPPGSNYIQGTAGPDNIQGTTGPDCIFGLGGNDVIEGGNDADYICGGSGADTINGGLGPNVLFGEGGNDIITGLNGTDSIDGGEGDDVLNGGNADDSLVGGPGVDTLDGGNGFDTCVEETPGTSVGLTNCEQTYSDSVDISGAFEVIDTRTPPVWQAVMDLPPGDCTITLSVWDGDEVVCIGSQTLPILEDGVTKYDIVLVCSLSIDTPDGVANVDGTFELITGNLCPKIYTLNAVPSSVGFAPPETEVQYRAKDPDNTCGSNCDPQTCTFDNPPICTPAPYNPNDPACNPAAGGDPNSAACQDGVSHVGLVCTIVAVSAANGLPAGDFISPQDETTPVGPVLPVNLNTASGLPGIILPGLGGPAAAAGDNPSQPSGGGVGDNPLYPALPNVNGSLPPLVYQCDPNFPGFVVINLVCSDGDAECDKSKQIQITCPGIDYCFGAPPDVCDGDNECFTDGLCVQSCNPVCDPTNPGYDPIACGGPDCTQCPGKNDPRPAGTACALGGQVCDGAGNCVECLADADCVNLPAPVIPGTCQLPNTCDLGTNTCVAGGAAPAGTACVNGECDGSGPPFGTSDPPCSFGPSPCFRSQVITTGCSNNVTADVSILPYQLDVEITVAVAGNPITANLGGIAEFSEAFLDAAQGAVPGGVTKAALVDLIASVQVRSGSTGAPINPISAGSTIPYECLLGDTGPGAQQPCNPANDQPSVPGLQPNTDCIPTGTFNPCVRIVVIPTSADCAPGGVCDTLGKAGQCTANGFCVTGGLPIPLDPVLGASLGTADPSGNVLIGWFDTPADTSAAVGTPPIDGDGTYNMQAITYAGVAGPIGLAVNAGGLAVQLECVMAEDSGGPLGIGVPDDASPTPDVALISCPIQVP